MLPSSFPREQLGCTSRSTVVTLTDESGAIGGVSKLEHPLRTLHDRRCRCPCKPRFRLAGRASAARELKPLERNESFKSHPSPFVGLILTQAECG